MAFPGVSQPAFPQDDPAATPLRSTTVTSTPCCWRCQAVASPSIPAPTTTDVAMRCPLRRRSSPTILQKSTRCGAHREESSQETAQTSGILLEGWGTGMPEAESARRDLDEIDRAILAALHDDARMSNTELARRARIAESTCHKRVRALIASG